MRSKYGTYDQYHTSLDDLNFISSEGLNGSYEAYIKVIESLEENVIYQNELLCEPQLSKRGLYTSLSTKDSNQQVETMMNMLTYFDGATDLLSIADKLEKPIWDLIKIVKLLKEHDLIINK